MKSNHALKTFCYLSAALQLVVESLSANDFKSLFDGKTLDGWAAKEKGYWSIRDGAITGQSSDPDQDWETVGTTP